MRTTIRFLIVFFSLYPAQTTANSGTLKPVFKDGSEEFSTVEAACNAIVRRFGDGNTAGGPPECVGGSLSCLIRDSTGYVSRTSVSVVCPVASSYSCTAKACQCLDGYIAQGDGCVQLAAATVSPAANHEPSPPVGESCGKSGKGKQGVNVRIHPPEPRRVYRIVNSPTSFYTYETDSIGRTVKVEATLVLGHDCPRRDVIQAEIAKKGGGEFDGGHLIGHQFNGAGESINVVPMARNVNQVARLDIRGNKSWQEKRRGEGLFYAAEKEWEGELKKRSPRPVKVNISVRYPDKGERQSVPEEFELVWQIGNEPQKRWTIPNVNVADLNNATEEQLKSLPGIGTADVKKIVAGRPYSSTGQLLSKKVLNADVYERIKHFVVTRLKM